MPVVTRPDGSGRGAVPNAEDGGSHLRSDHIPSHGQTESLGAAGSQLNLNASFQQRPEERVSNLQLENRKLEEEIENLRVSLKPKDDSGHQRKIQELFNKIQIENKNLRIYN